MLNSSKWVDLKNLFHCYVFFFVMLLFFLYIAVRVLEHEDGRKICHLESLVSRG